MCEHGRRRTTCNECGGKGEAARIDAPDFVSPPSAVAAAEAVPPRAREAAKSTMGRAARVAARHPSKKPVPARARLLLPSSQLLYYETAATAEGPSKASTGKRPYAARPWNASGVIDVARRAACVADGTYKRLRVEEPHDSDAEGGWP